MQKENSALPWHPGNTERPDTTKNNMGTVAEYIIASIMSSSSEDLPPLAEPYCIIMPASDSTSAFCAKPSYDLRKPVGVYEKVYGRPLPLVFLKSVEPKVPVADGRSPNQQLLCQSSKQCPKGIKKILECPTYPHRVQSLLFSLERKRN
ncbi:hypothetical protein AVEN_144384-1 [Araneus ventricosus]|uniref:Uncharacterized protein n=1 Tax=Araneus ventricosus TaxID=182803 RepID=A0A4Y2E687_ARAVE|nr:hypothetical protein AVEN_144384-1 [Araneus ventricosus]